MSAIREYTTLPLTSVLITIDREMTQRSIRDFVKSTKPSLIPPVDKAGIREHMLAIVTTCDLVSAQLSSSQMFRLLKISAGSRFASLNDLLYAGSFPI